MASWFAGRTAEDTAAASLHYHGGYGFMLEYDVQLYLRRAKAWRLAVGDPAGELAVVADRLDAAGWELEPPSETAEATTRRRGGVRSATFSPSTARRSSSSGSGRAGPCTTGVCTGRSPSGAG